MGQRRRLTHGEVAKRLLVEQWPPESCNQWSHELPHTRQHVNYNQSKPWSISLDYNIFNTCKVWAMQSTSVMFDLIKDVIKKYMDTTSLKLDKLHEINRTLNQLQILAVVAEAQNEIVRHIIYDELRAVQNRFMDMIKPSKGLFGSIMTWSGPKEDLTINKVWSSLAINPQVRAYRHLVAEIYGMKKNQQQKQPK